MLTKKSPQMNSLKIFDIHKCFSQNELFQKYKFWITPPHRRFSLGGVKWCFNPGLFPSKNESCEIKSHHKYVSSTRNYIRVSANSISMTVALWTFPFDDSWGKWYIEECLPVTKSTKNDQNLIQFASIVMLAMHRKRFRVHYLVGTSLYSR